MRRITYLFLLCATIAQAQPSVTGSTRIKVNEGNNTWITTLDNLLAGRLGVDSTFAKVDGTYTGKRIGDNAYKQGTLALRSTDTTGVLNILGKSTTKPGIYMRYLDASTNGFNWLRLDPDSQTDNSSVGSFYGWATNFVGANVPYSSRANHVWRIGYNTSQAGGRILTTDADLHMAFESNFTNVFESGRTRRGWEWHIESQDTTGGIHRVISARGAHSGSDGDISFRSDNYSFQPYAAGSAPFWIVDRNGQLQTWSDTMQTLYEKPMVGIPFARMRDAANTRYWKMFEPDASDRLVINSEGNGLVIGASTTQFPTSGLLYTSDATALRIGATGNRSGLDIFSNSDEALRLRGPNETTGWNLRPESAEFVLQSPAGVGTVYVHESAPATSIYVESTTGDVGFRITNPTARIHSYSSSGATQAMFRQENSTGSNALYRSNATPDGAITANPGDLAQTSISSLGELYLKETGTGNTGWKPVLTAYKVTKAVPTTTNATQEIGVITHNDGGRSALVQIDAVVAASGFAMQKRYIIPMGFSSTGGSWNILVPENAAENASWAGSNNFNLEMRTNTSGSPSGGVDTLRITRVAGSSAANCVLTIQIISQGANTTFTATSATGTSSTTTLYAQNALSQINNKVGINNIAPARTLHVTGEARITDLTTDAPTELLGADGDGDLAIVAKSAELTIATGTLKLAQQGATSGQVLEWNGSAWAPATDDTGGGGGSSYYQTIRDDGSGMTQRAALNFVSTSTVSAAATDDSGNNETEIALSIPTGGITATEIATDAVGSAEIAAGAVGSAEIASMSATEGQVLKFDGTNWGPAEVHIDAAPADITVNTNDFNPTNWSTVATHSFTASGGIWTITGFASLPGGTERTIFNDGNLAFVIASMHTGSTSANRVKGVGEYMVSPGGSITIVYVTSVSMWMVKNTTFDPTQLGRTSLGQYYSQTPGSVTAGDHPSFAWFTSGTSAALTTLTPGNGRPAGWQASTGTTTTGVSAQFFPKSIANYALAGDAHLVASATLAIPVLSDGTQRFTTSFGIVATGNTNPINVNNSITVQYTDNVNSAKFEFVTRNNSGTETRTDTGIAPTANTVYTITVVLNEPLNEARCYIATSGGLPVLAAINTTNLPTANTALGIRNGIWASVGTTGKLLYITGLYAYAHY